MTQNTAACTPSTHGSRLEHDLLELLRDIEVEAQPECRHPRQAGGEHVVHEYDESAQLHAVPCVRAKRAQRKSTHTAIAPRRALVPRNAAACIHGAWLRPASAAARTDEHQAVAGERRSAMAKSHHHHALIVVLAVRLPDARAANQTPDQRKRGVAR